MAEDAIIGFKFYDNDDIAEDTAISEFSDVLFSEASFDHLGSPGRDAVRVEEVRDVERSEKFDNFNFTEGFEFSF